MAELGLDVRTTKILEQHVVLLLGELLRLGREDLLAIGMPASRVDRMREMFGDVGLMPTMRPSSTPSAG